MVDYNQSQTVTIPSTDLVRFSILERRSYVIDSIELYNRKRFKGYDPETYEIKARLWSLYIELEGGFIQDHPEQIVKEFESKLLSDEFDELIEAFRQLNQYIFNKRLTNIFGRKEYDGTNVELENEMKGL